MATITAKAPEKGSNETKPTRRKFFNSPDRRKYLKKSVEQFRRLRGRNPDARETSAIVYFNLPIDRPKKDEGGVSATNPLPAPVAKK